MVGDPWADCLMTDTFVDHEDCSAHVNDSDIAGRNSNVHVEDIDIVDGNDDVQVYAILY